MTTQKLVCGKETRRRQIAAELGVDGDTYIDRAIQGRADFFMTQVHQIAAAHQVTEDDVMNALALYNDVRTLLNSWVDVDEVFQRLGVAKKIHHAWNVRALERKDT